PHNGFGPGSCHASPIGSLPSEDVRRTVAAHYLTAPGSQARAVQTTAPAAQREGRPSPATSTQTTAPTARAKDSPVPPPSARPGCRAKPLDTCSARAARHPRPGLPRPGPLERPVLDPERVQPGQVVPHQSPFELVVLPFRWRPHHLGERGQPWEGGVVDPARVVQVLGPHLRLRTQHPLTDRLRHSVGNRLVLVHV